MRASDSPRVLVVDDDPDVGALLEVGLRPLGYDVAWRPSVQEAMAALESHRFDVVLTDLELGAETGIHLLERIAATDPDLPVVVITAYGDVAAAVRGMRAGARDFLRKPLDLGALARLLEQMLARRGSRGDTRAGGLDDLIGESPLMLRVYALVEQLGDSDASVLLVGESGTGKELVARALHRRGRRAAGPFVAVNCAAVPEQLLESELFGHARGAFTDARAAHPGLFVQAEGGTLFLDEIGDMPLGVQAKILRALQERTVRPLGSTTEVPVDVRIIASAQVDLEIAVAARKFRRDLFYRINVVSIELPPLRLRGHDIVLLANHFVERFAERAGKKVRGISGEAAERLCAHPWPGNVRELINCMERAVALTRAERIGVGDLPDSLRRRHGVPAPGSDVLLTLEEAERRHIERVLRAVEGNKTLAAQVLGLDRRTLYRKLARHGKT